MFNSGCEVRGCSEESVFGWTFLGVLDCPKVQICSYHWCLHVDHRLKWNLFDEFGYPKPPVINPKSLGIRVRTSQDETEFISAYSEYSDVPCECGKQKLRRTIYCSDCANENRRESHRKSTQKSRDFAKVPK